MIDQADYNTQHIFFDDNIDSEESEIERDFTLEERTRIINLENKRDGMQKRTYELMKDDLYNGKMLIVDQ